MEENEFIPVDNKKTKKSTANIIQAQRDYFGAHGFNRTDQENSELLHGPWNKDKF